MYFETVEPKKVSQVLEKSTQSAQSARSAWSARSAVCSLQSAWSAFWGDPVFVYMGHAVAFRFGLVVVSCFVCFGEDVFVLMDLFQVVGEFSLEVVRLLVSSKFNSLYHVLHTVFKLLQFVDEWRWAFWFETVCFFSRIIGALVVKEENGLPMHSLNQRFSFVNQLLEESRESVLLASGMFLVEYSKSLYTNYIRSINTRITRSLYIRIIYEVFICSLSKALVEPYSRPANSQGSAESLTIFCHFSRVFDNGSHSAHGFLGKIFLKWNKLNCWIKMEYLRGIPVP